MKKKRLVVPKLKLDKEAIITLTQKDQVQGGYPVTAINCGESVGCDPTMSTLSCPRLTFGCPVTLGCPDTFVTC